jgi:hypothetical protein
MCFAYIRSQRGERAYFAGPVKPAEIAVYVSTMSNNDPPSGAGPTGKLWIGGRGEV